MTALVPPRRFQLSRAKGWRKPAGAVKVDRSTQWGNRYEVEPLKRKLIEVFEDEVSEFYAGTDRFRSARLVKNAGLYRTAEDAAQRICIARFQAYILDFHQAKEAIQRELQGKDLACWCKLCEEHVHIGKDVGDRCAACAPCHADVLLLVANGFL